MEKANKQAIIVLHEIYGVNEFIKSVCHKFKNKGFDVFCPNMIGRAPFPYEESLKAYDNFVKHVGFEVCKEIGESVHQLKEKYEKVFIVGFSIGATIAWKCCENLSCDGIIACYGSRIRDYTDLNPVCPTLLLVAKEDSFDVDYLVHQLQGKQHLVILKFDAAHGFMDSYTKHFDVQQSKRVEKVISQFLLEYGK